MVPRVTGLTRVYCTLPITIATREPNDCYNYCLINCSQGFKNHQLHDVLESPGSADLTADVDFAAVRRAALSEGEITITNNYCILING